MEKENIILSKSYEFSIRIVKLQQLLHREKHFELSSQLLRSGTSIGANVEEAIGGKRAKQNIGLGYYVIQESWKNSWQIHYYMIVRNY